jgi:MFS family permease
MTAAAAEEVRSVWKDGRFRSFWAGQTISQFGDRVSELALPLIAVTTLHASAIEVAWLTALVWLPNLVAVWLGAWVDHHQHKRRLMVLADLARALVLLSLPLTYALDLLSLGQLYLVAVLTGSAAVVFNTAYSSFFAHLVPRASYLDANSKLSTSRSASFVGGPALGGGLIQLLGAPLAVVTDALSFVSSALLVGRIRLDEPMPDAAEDGPRALLRRARAGIALVMHDPVLRAGLGCSTTINFFTFISGGLLVLFASRTLDLSSGAIGLAFGIGAAGSLVGAVIAPRMSRLIGLGRSIAVGAVLFPAPIAVAALASGPVSLRALALAVSEFLSGVGVMMFDVNLNSLQAATIPDGMRSRVSGAYSTINYGIRPLGAVVGGVLATWVGVRPTLVIAAVGGSLSLLWLLRSPIPRVRNLATYQPAPTTRLDPAATLVP